MSQLGSGDMEVDAAATELSKGYFVRRKNKAAPGQSRPFLRFVGEYTTGTVDVYGSFIRQSIHLCRFDEFGERVGTGGAAVGLKLAEAVEVALEIAIDPLFVESNQAEGPAFVAEGLGLSEGGVDLRVVGIGCDG